jgi:hypothetical protein
LAENLRPESNLCVRFQNFLAGAQVFAAAQIALNEIDKLAIEIAVVDRGDERERRNEHGK